MLISERTGGLSFGVDGQSRRVDFGLPNPTDRGFAEMTDQQRPPIIE
jgi:hypothetical protein